MIYQLGAAVMGYRYSYSITQWILFFFCYAFIGWIWECSFVSIKSAWKTKKWKFVNRGFLFGPWCPIYGLGAILILFTLLRYESDPIVVFVFGVIITSCVEYYTRYLLEKIFHNKWWDYSHRPDSWGTMPSRHCGSRERR